jgi:hypothetical protein
VYLKELRHDHLDKSPQSWMVTSIATIDNKRDPNDNNKRLIHWRIEAVLEEGDAVMIDSARYNTALLNACCR